MTDQRLQMLLAFVFGVLFLAAILVLATVFSTPTKTQYEIFRIIISLAAGGVAAVIPGLLDVQMNLGLTQQQKLVIRAGGALAVFVIVYFYNPAQSVVTNPTIQQTNESGCGVNTANNSGTISIKTDCK
jgi:hypothetical protein